MGWADPRQPGLTSPLGATFDPEKDNLRTALDAALTSPVGLAVAVGADGRYAGVATAATILDQVTQSKVAEPETIAVQEETDRGPDLPEGRTERALSWSKAKTRALSLSKGKKGKPIKPRELMKASPIDAPRWSKAKTRALSLSKGTKGKPSEAPSEPVGGQDTPPEPVEGHEGQPSRTRASRPVEGEDSRPEPVEGQEEQPSQRPEPVEGGA